MEIINGWLKDGDCRYINLSTVIAFEAVEDQPQLYWVRCLMVGGSTYKLAIRYDHEEDAVDTMSWIISNCERP